MNLSIGNFWRFYRASQARKSLSADLIRKVRWNSHRKTQKTRNCSSICPKRSPELGRGFAVWNSVHALLVVRYGADQQQFIGEWISADYMGDRSLGNAISMQNEPAEIVRCHKFTRSSSQQDIETLPEKNRRYLSYSYWRPQKQLWDWSEDAFWVQKSWICSLRSWDKRHRNLSHRTMFLSHSPGIAFRLF